MKKKYLKRKYRLRKKKPLYRKKSFWLGILILILFGEVFYLIIFSPIFQIKEVEIMGAGKVGAQDIQNIQNLAQSHLSRNFFLFSSKNIFFLKAKKIQEALLERFPEITNVNLKRKFPDRLVIEIEERRPVAIFCQGESEDSQKCFFIDREGLIFEEVSEENRSDYLVIKSVKPGLTLLGGMVLPREDLTRFLEIRDGLKDNLNIPLEHVFQANEEKLIAKTSQGWEIYFNLREDVAKQLMNLGLVLEKEIGPEKRGSLEYIDLRFGSRVFYKFNRPSTDIDAGLLDVGADIKE